MSNANEDHTQWLNDFNEQLKLLYGDKPVNIDQEFPSNSQYIKAADLQGKKVIVTIASVDKAKLGEDIKPVVFFEGKEKGLVLNVTNRQIIKSGYGSETDNWVGKEIALYSAKVPFQGDMVDAVRVELPQMMADESEAPF